MLPSYQSLDGAKSKRFASLNITTQTGRGSIDQESIEVRLASKPESPDQVDCRTTANLQRAWTKADFSLAFEPNDASWSLTAWAKNITNEVVKTGWVQSNILLADPRTYGATVTKQF